MADGLLFNNILLGGRGGTNPGQFRVHSGGNLWKKQGSGKVVEVNKAAITSLTWMKVRRTYQLGVWIKVHRFRRTGNMLTFLVDSKKAFEVSLADAAKTQLQESPESSWREVEKDDRIDVMLSLFCEQLRRKSPMSRRLGLMLHVTRRPWLVTRAESPLLQI